jgi:transposase
MARVIHPGSRLSAVRLAQVHAACDVLGMRRGFDENDLYANQRWLSERQGKIEDCLFRRRNGGRAPELFLYDVTSTYLEGKTNAFAEYGYSRDKKRGKKQIVVGLLCDEEGEPVSTEVFRGNTADAATFASQVRKAAQRFGCRRVTFVGDRGMIRSGQIEQLCREGFHYITAITKPQIETLANRGVIQMDMFDEELCEVEEGGVRYILRRNPCRAEEMAAARGDKLRCVERLVEKQNAHLRQHPRARVSTAEATVRDKIETLRIGAWLDVQSEDRTLCVCVNEEALKETSRLDGCYVIKTDLPKELASKETIHDRYKDLAEVEEAFRTCKTVHLEMRPVHVRTAHSTRAHVLVVMLAYMIRRELSRAWAPFDMTVEEGLDQLKTLCSTQVNVKGGGSCLRIPTPREQSRQLLESLAITLPQALPHPAIGGVVTRKKLSKNRRKP